MSAHRLLGGTLALGLSLFARTAGLQAEADFSTWAVYIANDNCPDYTWGFTEEQTRQAFADIVRGHLDEMKRTDDQPPENRDRYNLAVTQEALCFVERYPERKDELIRRIKEWRITVSPFLCNSLWGFHSTEAAIRTLYPARRLERDWGIPIDVAEHIEEPALPWGMATILADCGVRWLSVPFYNYDSTFSQLRNPPIFWFEGPDGSRVRTILDPYASNQASYMQGANMLRNPGSIISGWLPHYAKSGSHYPGRMLLASGTHGDINPGSGGQARQFADKIIQYNAQPGPRPKLINATLSQFCADLERQLESDAALPVIKGCFGHSWDLWPVSLAKYAADMRQGERDFLEAETLVSLAALRDPSLAKDTQASRERAEWCWAMLSDHAWNGTGEPNKRHNAELRKKWAGELIERAGSLTKLAWARLEPDTNRLAITLFNSLGFPRRELVRVSFWGKSLQLLADGKELPLQAVQEGSEAVAYFISPEVSAFGFASLTFAEGGGSFEPADRFSGSDTILEGPYYRLTIDPKTGGIASLFHKPTGTELVPSANGRTLGQTVYFDGKEHPLENVRCKRTASGKVLARLEISGEAAGIRVTNQFTLYVDIDRVEIDSRIFKPVISRQERLCHYFPVKHGRENLRIDTPGAVIRPVPQPKGDLLPGADTRRFAVQDFVDCSPPDSAGLTVVPMDAFALRLDLDELAFEALGNDQNYREVVQDQDRVQHFRFRYSIRARAAGYDSAKTAAWSQSVLRPLAVLPGWLPKTRTIHSLSLDPARAIALCLKPADDPASGSLILRLRETGGRNQPVRLAANGFNRAAETDLLERDRRQLPIQQGLVELPIRALGLASVRLQ